MKIKPLPQDVRSYLRSGVAITSLTQCIEELVLNSLDAGATCVAVRVDLNCFKVQVVDNGSGVPRDQLEMLGNRFCTSKCHTVSDLDNLCHFGYRGEALASIRDSCGILEITTRCKLINKTYCKIFQSGKSLKVSDSAIIRPSVGTTITVHELFLNFPVRQKSMNRNYEMERVREMLEGIALIRSGISFTLRNDSTRQLILSTRKCESIAAIFKQLYGSTKSDVLTEVKGSKQIFHIQGYVGREGHPRKNLQFVYVNGRLVKKSKIHKLLKKMLLNLSALKPKSRQPSDSPQMAANKQNLFSSPPKFSEAYPVYILEVKCPISEYDITFEPAKTLVEFKDWDTLLACVEEVIKAFLDKENVGTKLDAVERANGETDAAYEKDDDGQNNVISADNMKDVLSSKTVKKVTKQTDTKIILETPDNCMTDESKSIAATKQLEEDTLFKTPANRKVEVCKAVAGLGKRKIGLDSDTEDNDSTLAESNTTFSDSSSSDDSAVKCQVRESSEINKVSENREITTVNKQSGKYISSDSAKYISSDSARRKSTECSLSRYKQSIGKFMGRQSANASVDESLKKLNRIIPSVTKPNCKIWFSSLQKFRRKLETSNAVAETECDQMINNEEVSRLQNSEVVDQAFRNQLVENVFHRNVAHTLTHSGLEYNTREVSITCETKTPNVQRQCHVELNQEDVDDGMVYMGRRKLPLEDNDHNCVLGDLPSQRLTKPFDFVPCYESAENAETTRFENQFVSNDHSNSNVLVPRTDLSEIINLEGNYNVHSELEEIAKYKQSDMMSDQHNAICEDGQNIHSLDTDESYQNFVYSPDKFIDQNTKYSRKRPIWGKDSHGCEKQYKYMARTLASVELVTDAKYKQRNCDIENNVCNSINCVERNVLYKTSDRGQDICDRHSDYGNVSYKSLNIDPDSKGEPMHSDADCSKDWHCEHTNLPSGYTRDIAYNAAQFDPGFTETMNFDVVGGERQDLSDAEDYDKDCHSPYADKGCEEDKTTKESKQSECKTELNSVISTYEYSTQPFSPKQSSSSMEEDNTPESTEKVHTHSPESLGFTPNIQTELLPGTPCSMGFSPVIGGDSIMEALQIVNVAEQNTIESSPEQADDRDENLTIESEEYKFDRNEYYNGVKNVNISIGENHSLHSGICETVTVTQLLKTPSQQTCYDMNGNNEDSFETETDTLDTVVSRKGFIFSDLFSQTPASKSVETESENTREDFGHSSMCSDCDYGLTTREGNVNCTEKGYGLDIVGENIGNLTCNLTKDSKREDTEILWSDSPWIVSDSSHYQSSDTKLDKVDVEEQDICQLAFGNDNAGCTVGDSEDAVGEIADPDNNSRAGNTEGPWITQQCEGENKQELSTRDSLESWYQNLDIGLSGSTEMFQSKKPSDVVRRLHACNFSKDSLKSVKVLGQLDKKFIVCLINTEQQSDTYTDATMLVMIDQHAAHERIRLEVLTEEAFQYGVKGGKLEPLAIHPPQPMVFTENEIRTILSLQNEYDKLGIKLKMDTPTTVLVSSVPACLVDKEKNNKIYWSTVQVLIREHIAVFMSTKVLHGVLPQTIHKVLCSLACHGAIKFGDRLGADECVKLISDLSRCDLPFQCAHGRPSLIPLFHTDNLKPLSQLKHQEKPKLWKITQAVKLKQNRKINIVQEVKAQINLKE